MIRIVVYLLILCIKPIFIDVNIVDFEEDIRRILSPCCLFTCLDSSEISFKDIEVLYPPVDGDLLLPFTVDESIDCGNWREGSLDYPYYGAKREGDRLHGAIDIYTSGSTASDGGGMVVRAIKSGTVVEIIERFYQRSSTGEITQAVLIDHGCFVACYCEIRGEPNQLGAPLNLMIGDQVEGADTIGYVSGTKQLHFELYRSGTLSRTNWYGTAPPDCLLDPTEFILCLY